MDRATRAVIAQRSLAFYEEQLFQAELDLAAAVADPDLRKQLERKIANLTRGLAEIRRRFAAELRFQPKKGGSAGA